MEKKDRIRVIFPDYLDGSRETPKALRYSAIGYIGQRIYHYLDHIELFDGHQNIPEPLQEEVRKLIAEMDGLELLENLFRCMTRTIKHYEMKPKDNRNFILSKPLSEAFSSTPLDIKPDNLPKDFAGYIDLNKRKTKYVEADGNPHEAEAIGAYVSIMNTRLTIVSIFLVDNIYAPYYHSYDLDTGDKISDIVAAHPDQLREIHYSISNVNTVLSAVLYITHAPNDLMKYLYEFPRSEKKAARLKPHYTEKPVTIVGKFFKLPNKYKDDWIQNKGYFGWRWTGVGRSTLKYVWVRPSKPYKKGV